MLTVFDIQLMVYNVRLQFIWKKPTNCIRSHQAAVFHEGMNATSQKNIQKLEEMIFTRRWNKKSFKWVVSFYDRHVLLIIVLIVSKDSILWKWYYYKRKLKNEQKCSTNVLRSIMNNTEIISQWLWTWLLQIQNGSFHKSNNVH